ncbi:MAG: TetR family transcriptional regulator C-terminal domain-containing protein [Alphaproteobacteria bacterium]|nr:TetR family transcriptional regulator C-terminal domain-containing protein [Alphaproteobacteria bacterium]
MSKAALKDQEGLDSDKFKKGTPAKLVKAAEQLFWYQGHKATSIDEIVQKTKQSKGAFFHYFSSKNDVTKVVIERYAREEIAGPLEKYFAQTSDIKEALLIWAQDVFTQAMNRRFKGGCMLGNMALELSDQDDEIRQQLAHVFLDWENQLSNFFREEGRRGSLLMEPRQFARVVIATLEGFLMSAKVHKDKRRAAREFQALAELFERLIRD